MYDFRRTKKNRFVEDVKGVAIVSQVVLVR